MFVYARLYLYYMYTIKIISNSNINSYNYVYLKTVSILLTKETNNISNICLNFKMFLKLASLTSKGKISREMHLNRTSKCPLRVCYKGILW